MPRLRGTEETMRGRPGSAWEGDTGEVRGPWKPDGKAGRHPGASGPSGRLGGDVKASPDAERMRQPQSREQAGDAVAVPKPMGHLDQQSCPERPGQDRPRVHQDPSGGAVVTHRQAEAAGRTGRQAAVHRDLPRTPEWYELGAHRGSDPGWGRGLVGTAEKVGPRSDTRPPSSGAGRKGCAKGSPPGGALGED